MTSRVQTGSAKIYAFPPGGRAGLATPRVETRPAAETAPVHAAKMVFGSSWYHDAAIQDAERSDKH